MKRIKNGKYDEKPVKAPANKFCATFTKLKRNTSYCFKIRTCYEFRISKWSKEIETKTRIYKGIKATLSPVVRAIGTATSPILMPFVTGAAAAAGEMVEEKILEV